MPVNKKQMRRLVMLAAELKKNNYPSTKSFTEKLKNMDLYENQNIKCSSKTIQRDIKTLQDDFNAPIVYNPEMRGYELTHHGWSFNCPIFEEHELVATILGARLAEEIFPNPLKTDIQEATDTLLTENNPDLLDSATIQALIVASGLKVNIDPEVFQVVFDGWTKKEAIDIEYKSVSGHITKRTIEPHVLAYQEYSWFIKAHCLLRDEIRTFAVHRIQNAELTGLNFDLNPEIIEIVKDGMLFDYHKIKNIQILCDPSIAPYVIDQPLHSRQKIEKHADMSFTVTIPEATEYDLVEWVLGQAGRATLIAPKSLKAKIAKTANEIFRKHG